MADNVRGRDLGDFLCGQIYALRFHAKWTYSRIADELELPLSTITMYCRRAQIKENVGDVPSSSRKNCGGLKSTTDEQDHALLTLSSQNRFASAAGIVQQNPELGMSLRTAQRRLKCMGMLACRPAQKTKLDDEHRALRFKWANDLAHWTAGRQWKRVLFSDESAFDLSESHVRYVRRRVGERYSDACVATKENRSRAHVQIWGAFSDSDFTNLSLLDGRTDAAAYVHLLETNLLPHRPALLPHGGVLQHDNAPCHRAHLTQQWLRDQHVDVLQWPALSPDMNPIENVWGNMARILHNEYERPKSTEELFATLQAIWGNLMSDAKYRNSLISSMPTRLRLLQEAQGGYTRY